MNPKNDEPAFPKLAYIAAPDGKGDMLAIYEDYGLTKRELFSAMAMSASFKSAVLLITKSLEYQPSSSA